MSDTPWCDAYYRWNWFRREQWWPQYRKEATAAGGKLRRLLELIPNSANARILDATCGQGRQTLSLEALGLRMTGSDACAYAVANARELAREERSQTQFFVSAWTDLSRSVPDHFDAVVVDAFADCLEEQKDLHASFAGVAAVLKRGGLFIYPGPTEEDSPEVNQRQAWEAAERFHLDWEHATCTQTCTCVHARTWGEGFIDEHSLYLIGDAGAATRLETATIRRWFHWTRRQLNEAALAAGFGLPVTRGSRIVACRL